MALIPALLGLLVQGPVPLDRALDEPAAPGQVGPAAEKYVGVAPGPHTRNPLPSAPRRETPHLIWSGFQMAEQGSRLFFQTTGPVTFDLKEGKATLTVLLKNTRIHLKNNARRLDTRFFATPVQGVSARQHRKDVELRIALKEPASATPRSEEGPDGTHFLVLEFPPGRPASAPTSRPIRPREDASGEGVTPTFRSP